MRVRGSAVEESMYCYRYKVTEPEKTLCCPSSPHLWELGKGAVSQHGDMTQQLVDTVAEASQQRVVLNHSVLLALFMISTCVEFEGIRLVLTALGSAWGRTRAGYTGCTGTLGMPNWPGSLWLRADLPLDGVWILYALCLCVCVCVCVWERERETEMWRKKEEISFV